MSYFTDQMRQLISMGYFMPPAPQGMFQQPQMQTPYTQMVDVSPFGTMGQSAGQVPGSFGNITRTLQELANHLRVPQMYGGEEGLGVPQVGPGYLWSPGVPANQ